MDGGQTLCHRVWGPVLVFSLFSAFFYLSLSLALLSEFRFASRQTTTLEEQRQRHGRKQEDSLAGQPRPVEETEDEFRKLLLVAIVAAAAAASLVPLPFPIPAQRMPLANIKGMPFRPSGDHFHFRQGLGVRPFYFIYYSILNHNEQLLSRCFVFRNSKPYVCVCATRIRCSAFQHCGTT